MKTRILPIAALLLCLSGCSTQRLNDKLVEFDRLGITEAVITGKFSNTEYHATRANGVKTSTLDHNDTWLTKVHIVRESKE